MLASRVDPILCHLLDTQISFMGFDLLLLMFPKKIQDFLGQHIIVSPYPVYASARQGENRFLCTLLFITHVRLLNFFDSVDKASFLYSVHLKTKGYRQKCMFGFLVEQSSFKQKLSWSFLSQIHSHYLATPPGGYAPMRKSGVLVEKVPKTYFVGVAWTLFTSLRDTISVITELISVALLFFFVKIQK